MDISAPTKKDLMVPAPFALESTSQHSSNSALDTEAFLDPSAACVKPPCRPPSFIPHTSMDTLMPNTSAFIKPLSHYDNPRRRRLFTHTSTPLDMANTADYCPNTAPMMKEEECRKGFPVGRTQNTFNRHVTFCKRRNGLFRKAHELSGLCDAEVAAIVFSPSGKLSEFASSSLSHIIKRYQSFQPQMLPNDLLLQDVERWEREAVSLDARLKRLQEFQRCVFETNSMTASINQVQNIESMLEYSLDKIQKRKMELLEVETHKIKKKGEVLFLENNVLKEKLAQKLLIKEGVSNSSKAQKDLCYNRGKANAKLHLW